MTDEAKAPMGGEVEEAVKRLTWMLGNAEGAANYDVLPDPDRDEASKDADYEGHGGSPGEGLYERSGELEGQLKKRGLWPVPHQEGAVR